MPSIADDRDEIVQLLYRYCHTFDSGDSKAWSETFAEDGVMDSGGRILSGREELAAFSAKNGGGKRHVPANPLIEISGDTATVRSYGFVFGAKVMTTAGIYQDQLVRTPEGWRFAKRAFTSDAT